MIPLRARGDAVLTLTVCRVVSSDGGGGGEVVIASDGKTDVADADAAAPLGWPAAAVGSSFGVDSDIL